MQELKALRRKEKRLDAAWVIADFLDDREKADRIRVEYFKVFEKLVKEVDNEKLRRLLVSGHRRQVVRPARA